MGQFTLSGNPPIAVALRRSSRARRLSLRLSQLDGRVTLTLPKGVSEAEGRAFVLAKESWLRRHLDRRDAPVDVGLGAQVPIAGELCEITHGTGRSVIWEDNCLKVPGDPDAVAARVRGWLRAQARERLAEASDHFAHKLDRPYNRITLRDTRSRWGSCTHDGGLMYSWRLMMAPPDVLDYVAAHEVAHLAEMNHSPAFWAVVERLYGDWRAPRSWLRNQGTSLHLYRFGD